MQLVRRNKKNCVANLSVTLYFRTNIDSALAEEVFAGTHQGELLWAITDHGRSVRGVLDNNGALVNHIEYDDYGNILASVDAAKTTVTEQAIDAAFAGREWDADANHYYNRARWYDPGEGRFISQDPIGFSGGDINLYRYAAGDPVNYFDPSGQSWLSKWVDDVGDDINGIIDNANSFFSDPIDYINNYAKGTMLSLMYAVENPEEVLKAKIKDPYFWAGLVVGAHASWGFFNANLSANGLSAGFSIFNAGPPAIGIRSPLANFAQRFVGAFATGNDVPSSYTGEGTGVIQASNNETIIRGQKEQTWGEYFAGWGNTVKDVTVEGGLGLLQGGANLFNAGQDIIGETYNLGAYGVNGIAWVEQQFGIIDSDIGVPYYDVDASDWSRGLFTQEYGEGTYWADTHRWSKFGGVVAIEAGMSAKALAQRGIKFSGAIRDRIKALGFDPAINKVRIKEGIGGLRIENAIGRTIKRSAHEGADFVDDILGPISLKGPIPSRGSVKGLANSVIKDVKLNRGADHVFVDLRGLTSKDNALVRNLVRDGIPSGSSKAIHYMD